MFELLIVRRKQNHSRIRTHDHQRRSPAFYHLSHHRCCCSSCPLKHHPWQTFLDNFRNSTLRVSSTSTSEYLINFWRRLLMRRKSARIRNPFPDFENFFDRLVIYFLVSFPSKPEINPPTFRFANFRTAQMITWPTLSGDRFSKRTHLCFQAR